MPPIPAYDTSGAVAGALVRKRCPDTLKGSQGSWMSIPDEVYSAVGTSLQFSNRVDTMPLKDPGTG